MEKFWHIDTMIGGSNSLQLNFHQEWEDPLALCNSRRRNHKVGSRRGEGP